MRQKLHRLTSDSTTVRDPHFLVHRKLFEALRSSAQFARGRLLDIGCGNKPYEHMFSTHVSEYFGCDVAQSSLGRVDLICDSSNIPLPSEAFETVLSTQVIEHVPDPFALVSEAYRLVRPNGVFILSGPMYWCAHEEPYDFYRFTAHGFRQMLEQAGFQVEKFDATGGCWAVCGLAFLHALNTTRFKWVGFQIFVNWIFSRLDDHNAAPINSANYLFISRKPLRTGPTTNRSAGMSEA